MPSGFPPVESSGARGASGLLLESQIPALFLLSDLRCGRQSNDLQNVYCLVPATCDFVRSHDKGELYLQVKLMLLISWPWQKII